MAVTKRAGRKKDAQAQPQADRSGGQPNIRKAQFDFTKKKEVGVSDLTLISQITNDAINDNLKKRFENAEIYTYIGHVLVSVNPFRDLGIYTEQVLDSYRGKNRLEVPPHVFAIAESAYHNMKAYKENQCVIISGESGAGKTEAAKRLMQYIANVSGPTISSIEEIRDMALPTNSSIQEIKDMVLATNPLLESFGNAKTLRNNNSSRFGKYLEIQFNKQGEPVGANINNYLLEKSRVVGQIRDERNFHIFYQFTKAASQDHRTNFGVQQPKTYLYTSKSNCYDVAGIDDVAEFKDTLNAMRVIGMSQAEQDDIFRMLAAILWIGNVSFAEDEDGNASVRDQSVIDFVAYLLEVDAAHVNKALTTRIIETSRGGRRGSVYDSPMNIAQSTAVRDALSKAIYTNMFDWIVQRVNRSLRAREDIKYSIGILDIYGFEIFEKNSFEQLCINYVNEKLQQIFIQLTLKTEQDEYEREQIKWTPIKYFDNKVVCELIEEKRPPGVFAALNDACATAHADPAAADQTFVSRLNALSSNPNFQPRQGQFVIKHYAGDVHYAVEGMTDKNKDQLLKDLLNLVAQSQNSFVHTLFPEQVNQDNRRRPPTAGDKIISSANDLVATLMRCTPSYIRTIKPNENKSPTEYNTANVLHQVKYLGLQENVRIRRAGFAYRQAFDKFVERFYVLSPKTNRGGELQWDGDMKSAARQILKDTFIPAEEWQMGVTKAFIKTPETLFALETMRDRYGFRLIIRIQRAWRNYLRYRAEAAARIQRFWRKKKNGGEDSQKLRDEGHRALAGRKERRRYSLIGYRRFMGDYLGIDKKGGSGEILQTHAQIGAGEKTYFSCRAEILVSKLGRSSKLEARFLVLTSKNIYLIKQVKANNVVQISSERTIPLGAIKYVSTSSLQDDWFSLGIGSPQEPDPLLNCIFKTEFFTQLKQASRGTMDLRIGETIQYNKKPGKPATIKAVRDPQVQRGDMYKSGQIHVGPGQPPNSVSRPTPKGKPRAARPITSGGLLKKSPRGALSQKWARERNAMQAEPLPRASARAISRVVPVPQPQMQVPQARPVASLSNGTSHARNVSAASTVSIGRVPPPPPPPPPAAATPPKFPQYEAVWEYNPDPNEGSLLGLEKGEVVFIIEKPKEVGLSQGWWRAQRSDKSASGWVPASYLKEVEQALPPVAASRPPPPQAPAGARANGFAYGAPAAKAKPKPPAPPAKRPAGRKPVSPATPRDSAYSNSSSDPATPSSLNGSGIAGLAKAIRAMEKPKHPNNDADADW